MTADTEPHLGLDQLLAGEPRPHLASCPDCRAEQVRWAKVSAATRSLAAATDLPPWRFPAEPAGCPRRRVLLSAAAAAALLAAGGTAWGLASSSGSAPATTAGLTAVTGCPGLAVTSGTLEQISGTRLVVRTRDGHDVTVTASASTVVRVEERGSLSDITDGARVLVTNDPRRSTATTVTARNILVDLAQLPPQHLRPSSRVSISLRPGQLLVLANGSVVNVHPGGFTVSTSLGFKIRVVISAATVVDKLALGQLGQLRAGVQLIAVGQSGPDGTLTASTL